MKKYLVNKDIDHDGKLYKKGSEIKEGDKGFKEILNAGHAQMFEFADGDAEPKLEEPKSNVEVVSVQGGSEKQSKEPAKSVGKSKK